MSKVGASSLRRTLFLVMSVYLQNSLPDEPVYQFMDKKRSEGKPYRVYMMASATNEHRDEWQKQQIHLLRCWWGKTNRVADRRRIGVEKTDPSSIREQINQWYQRAKTAGWDRAELQWHLNQILEQEHEHELD